MRYLVITLSSLLLISAVACTPESELRESDPSSSQPRTPRFEPQFIDTAFTVLPGGVRTYELEVPAGASTIDVRWSSSSDVNVTLAGSGGVRRSWQRALGTRLTIDVPTGGGFYVFTFSNEFSVLTNKNIAITGTIR